MVAAVAPQAQAGRLSDKLAERIKLLDKVSNSTFDVAQKKVNTAQGSHIPLL